MQGACGRRRGPSPDGAGEAFGLDGSDQPGVARTQPLEANLRSNTNRFARGEAWRDTHQNVSPVYAWGLQFSFLCIPALRQFPTRSARSYLLDGSSDNIYERGLISTSGCGTPPPPSRARLVPGALELWVGERGGLPPGCLLWGPRGATLAQASLTSITGNLAFSSVVSLHRCFLEPRPWVTLGRQPHPGSLWLETQWVRSDLWTADA